jgi:hypothetical protein
MGNLQNVLCVVVIEKFLVKYRYTVCVKCEKCIYDSAVHIFFNLFPSGFKCQHSTFTYNIFLLGV